MSNGLDPDLSVLIWVQTVWKGYQQMIEVAASMEGEETDNINTI